MNYIMKDLMITVLPKPGDILAGCDAGPTGCQCTGCTGCTGDTKQTKPPGCPLIRDIYAEISNPNPVTILALKQQLLEALAAVEVSEKLLQQSHQPKTVSESEALEKKLEAALHELRSRRQTKSS